MNKKKDKYIFIGNRFNVLEEMLGLTLDVVSICAVKNSFLEKELKKRKIKYTVIESKSSLIDLIQSTAFDVLVSNGCPYILPVSRIKKEDQIFVNVHPSLLPDLKGINPINGAILFNRDAGATCHHMDDGIDTGAIIAQKKITLNETITLPILYKLSFMAEADVFSVAYKQKFVPVKRNFVSKNLVYYSRKNNDMVIDFHKPLAEVMRVIRAFGIPTQGATFLLNDHSFRVLSCQVLNSDYLNEKLNSYSNLQIIYVYGNNILLKKDDQALILENIIGNISLIEEGMKLG